MPRTPSIARQVSGGRRINIAGHSGCPFLQSNGAAPELAAGLHSTLRRRCSENQLEAREIIVTIMKRHQHIEKAIDHIDAIS